MVYFVRFKLVGYSQQHVPGKMDDRVRNCATLSSECSFAFTMILAPNGEHHDEPEKIDASNVPGEVIAANEYVTCTCTTVKTKSKVQAKKSSSPRHLKMSTPPCDECNQSRLRLHPGIL